MDPAGKWLHFQQLMTGACNVLASDPGSCLTVSRNGKVSFRVSDRFQIFHQTETTTILSHQMINIVCQKSYCTNTQIHEMLLTWGDSTPQFDPSPAKTHRITSDFFQNCERCDRCARRLTYKEQNILSSHQPFIPSSHPKQVQYDNWQVPVSY